MIIDFDEKKVSMWLYFSSRRSTRHHQQTARALIHKCFALLAGKTR
jgi:hypothetical protein